MHGIAGFGKTVLAAEAVRDAEILSEVFPGEYSVAQYCFVCLSVNLSVYLQV